MKIELDVTFHLSAPLQTFLNTLLATAVSRQITPPSDAPAPAEAKPAPEKKAKKAKPEPVVEPEAAPAESSGEPTAPPAVAPQAQAAPAVAQSAPPAASSSVTVATLAPMVTETVKKLGVAPVRALLEKYKAKQLVELGANIGAFSADLAELRKTSGLL